LRNLYPITSLQRHLKPQLDFLTHTEYSQGRSVTSA